MKRVAMLLLATLVACTDPTPPPAPAQAPTPTPDPIVITIPTPPELAPAKFKVGDAVNVEGLSEGKITEVGDVVLWTNIMTGEEVLSRAYLVEVTFQGRTEVIRVPEIVLSAKQ